MSCPPFTVIYSLSPLSQINGCCVRGEPCTSEEEERDLRGCTITLFPHTLNIKICGTDIPLLRDQREKQQESE